MAPFPDESYDVVLADPPWDHYGDPKKMAAAGKHYDLMKDDDLLALPVGGLIAKRGVLFLWATCPRLDFAVDCIRSWGLHYRGVAFVWIKTSRAGTPIKAQGVRPSVVKPLVEFVLVGSRVRRGRPMPVASESVIQTVFAPRDSKHSAKPAAVRQRIEALYPAARRIELFARDAAPNWDRWGKEAPL